jgi:hypothetical protein
MDTGHTIPPPDVRKRLEQAMSQSSTVDTITDLARLTGVSQQMDISDLVHAIEYNTLATCPLEWSGTQITGGGEDNCKTLASLFILVIGLSIVGNANYAQLFLDQLTICQLYKQYVTAGVAYIMSGGNIDPVRLGTKLVFGEIFIHLLTGVSPGNMILKRTQIYKAFQAAFGNQTTGGARRQVRAPAKRRAPARKAMHPEKPSV